jgi:UDP-glucose 4-epimerase
MWKSLVTGGAGFIGSHLVNALLARGDEVRVLDNFSTGKEENLRDSLGDLELIRGDLLDEGILTEAVKDIDLIFHQAAFVSVPLSLEKPETCFDTNVIGTKRLLTAARNAGVRRVVMASSAAVYGESQDLPLSEETSPDPLSPYAASKQVGEIYASLFTSQLGLDAVALRYFNVYGPRQNPESDYAAVIPIFIRKLIDEEEPVIFGDGLQSRDFVYVDDVVEANLLAAESDLVSGKVFNICSGTEIDLVTLVENLSEIFGRKINPIYQEKRAGDIHRSLGDPSKAKQLLNFQAKVDLSTGLEKTTTWMKGH